ncbi:polysaccharide deacetylase family protein [Chitinophaga niabensis]|uniref:Polysaccharide deacetylase n=1 Tax=Chitinophaga niabensis TaxID=536979 RepID=A0A1N6D1V8_9BACT|nr:polysaccharide deacetylase family protein [Chitinophaga niabensis]SIN64775.1 Polysaccharide deacetylase [Chitinophaga niabensis]
MKNKILISVDVEEFDIPEEYGQKIPLQEKLLVSYRGVVKTMTLFEELNIRATFFITAYWAQNFPDMVKRMAAKHEIASHAFYHDVFEETDLLDSRNELEYISGQKVKGFRMPRLKPVNMESLEKAGYTYDASLNPTWIPGRYNNRKQPRYVHRKEALWVMPSSVTPRLRLPVFWLSVKNFPLWFTRYCSRRILQKEDYFSFYFHPWELEDLSSYKLPLVVKSVSGTKMHNKMRRFLAYLSARGEFISHSDYLEKVHSGGKA